MFFRNNIIFTINTGFKFTILKCYISSTDKYSISKCTIFEDDITIYNKDFRDFKLEDDFGVLITNPPYGERLGNVDVKKLEQDLGKKMKPLKTWSNYIITSSEMFEKNFGKKADKNRKLYNGKIKVDYYQFFGPKPNYS